MRKQKTVKRTASIILLALALVATSLGAWASPLAQEPQFEPMVPCGDSASCSMAGSAFSVQNSGTGAAIYGRNTSAVSGSGVYGRSQQGAGVRGQSNSSNGVFGTSYNTAGVRGKSTWGTGVKGESVNSTGVYGEGAGGAFGVFGKGMVGVKGEAVSLGAGVQGVGNIISYGVWAYNEYNHAFWATNAGGIGKAGIFDGDVDVNGTLSKTGGSFKIDHPLDPENQYLYHSFVESPDMMNVYNGNVVLDENGEAWVELPDYFEALNRDYRYQLTAIGAPGPNLYIAEEIAGNRFKIAGGQPGAQVSWQVTGIRQDPWANANRIPVEEEKPVEEQGFYLFPELYGQPESMKLLPIPGVEP